MPTAIYIASPEGDTGKSTIALGILHRLAATVAKVGVFRPITRLGEDRDYILNCCCLTPPRACPTTSASASAINSCTKIQTRRWLTSWIGTTMWPTSVMRC